MTEWDCLTMWKDASRERAEVSFAGLAGADAMLCAYWRMCSLHWRLLSPHSSSLGAVATALWPRSYHGDAPVRAQSHSRQCSIVYSTGLARGWNVWRSHWRLSRSGGAGRAMLSSVPVSFARCRRGSSWRMQQLVNVQCEMAQHVLYRLKEIIARLAEVASKRPW